MSGESSETFKGVLDHEHEHAPTELHLFLLRFKSTASEVYGFVEGKTDCPFYFSLIPSMLPDGWTVWLAPVGNRDKVLALMSSWDHERFGRGRVSFFVDRDFHHLCGNHVESESLYTPPGYSIENSVLSWETFLPIIRDFYGVQGLTVSEEEAIKNRFVAATCSAAQALKPSTAQMLSWRVKGLPVSLQDVRTAKLVTWDGVAFATSLEAAVELESRCGQSASTRAEIVAAERMLPTDDEALILVTRGKQMLDVFVMMLKSAGTWFASSVGSHKGKTPKMSVSIGASNAIAIISPRCAPPECLMKFVEATYLSHIRSLAHAV